MASGSQSLYAGSDEIYNQDCDVCLSNGKTSEAISYYNIYCEHLCHACDSAHRGSKATRDHTILIGSNIPSLSTRKQPTLPFMFCDTHRTSVLGSNRPIDSGPNQTSIRNISVKEKRAIDVMSNKVWGCTFMPDGHVVLGCGEAGLKLFDENFLLKTQLSVYSGDVSTINDTDVIVTQDIYKQLQRVRIFPGMEVKKTLKMGRNCYGVDVNGEKIYVTCHDRPGNGEVRVLNMDGIILRRLGVDIGKYIFTSPYYVQVSNDGRKVFVADYDTNTVTCLNSQGHMIYRYSDTDLRTPAGMYVDGEDNLLVCGVNSNNVHMIRDDGRREKIVLSEKNGLHLPVCVSFRPTDGCLMVGLHVEAITNQKLIIFSTR